MEITRRADYAIRIMLELARSGGGPVSVRKLAESQEVPYAFARNIQRDLVSAGLATTRRGTNGGLILERPPGDVTLLDIVEATQGLLSCSMCTTDPEWCSRMGGCRVHHVWRGADELMRAYLKEKDLAGLLTNKERKVGGWT